MSQSTKKQGTSIVLFPLWVFIFCLCLNGCTVLNINSFHFGKLGKKEQGQAVKYEICSGKNMPERLQKSRLDMAYNNDGPGFNRDMVDTPEYRRVAHKLKTFIPEESIVGVLLEHSEDYYVIASNNRGILQHESLSWQTMANHFVYLDARSGMGKMSDELVRQWVNSMTPEEREKFCDAFFDVLSMEGKVSSLDQLEKEGLAGKAALLKQFIGADEEKRRILTDMFRRLAADAGEEVKKSVGGGRKWAAETMQSWKGKVYKITKKR